MKTITTILTCLVLLSSCHKDEFDLDNPDVSKFASQLKNGTYNEGEMPAFTMKHVPQLIEYAKDTSHIPDCGCIPHNRASSRGGMVPHYRPYIILGEYLLWCVQGAIDGTRFPSLDPFLVDSTFNGNYQLQQKGVSGEQIMQVQKQYENWWLLYGEKDNPDGIRPLDGTPYRWF